jgi:aryl carrier-like protein
MTVALTIQAGLVTIQVIQLQTVRRKGKKMTFESTASTPDSVSHPGMFQRT